MQLAGIKRILVGGENRPVYAGKVSTIPKLQVNDYFVLAFCYGAITILAHHFGSYSTARLFKGVMELTPVNGTYHYIVRFNNNSKCLDGVWTRDFHTMFPES